jgi:hypothetical protein
MRTLIRAGLLGALATSTLIAQSRAPSGRFEALGRIPAAPRLVAIGDVHGAYDSFLQILQSVGLVDGSRRWSGGSATLVQTGDITDRGAQVRETMDLLMALELQAAASGGRVLALLGNHEAMNMVGDLHDVSAAAYASFVTEESEARREKAYEEYAELCRVRREAAPGVPDPPAVPAVYQLPDKDAWMKAHPPGFLEYVEAFGPEGYYGRWLRSRQSVVQVGDTLFLHGGISPRFAKDKPDDLSRQVQRELRTFDDYRQHLVSRQLILPWFDIAQILQAVDFERKLLLSAASQPAAPDSPSPLATLDQRHAAVLDGMQGLGGWAIFREDGPLWFRGYAMWDPEQGAEEAARILERQRVRRIVVGHTIPATMRITPRFQRSVYLIDTGMLASAYTGGRASALEIEGDRVIARYVDSAIQLDPPQTASAVQWVSGRFGR